MLKKFLIPLIALGTWLSAGQLQPVQAAVNDFTAKAVLPADNAPNVSHFNLVVKPDTTRTLSVAVSNEADTAQKFVVEAANAVTNSNGIIAYDRGAAKTKPGHVAFCDLFPDARKRVVTIPAHSQQVVSFDIKLPPTPFAGLILGGFNVRSLTAAEEAAKQGQIANLANYTIGAVLREDTAAVSPQLKLTGAQYRSVNSLPTVAIGLTNPTPTIIGTVSLKAKVTNADKRVVAKAEVDQRNFAPSNAFTYSLPTKDNKALKPGRYHLTMTVKADNGQWRFSRSFTVTAKAVKQNKIVHHYDWQKLFWRLIDGLAVLIILGFLIAKLKQRLSKKK